MNKNLQSALMYARMSWPVFPCHPLTKEPLGSLVPRGHLNATLDEDQIHGWWGNFPEANVAIAIPEWMAVVDIDSVEALSITRNMPRTVMSKTPRKGGGYHLVYSLPKGVELKKQLGFFKGVDLLTHGCYFVAPDSQHPNGGHYTWINHPGDMMPAELPQWVIDQAIKEHELKTFTVNGKERDRLDPAKILDGVPEGARNNSLWRFGSWMRTHKIPWKMALNMMEEAAKSAIPPYEEVEMKDMLARIWTRYPEGKTGEMANKRDRMTLNELLDAKLPEPIWYVERILPQGFCLFYAHPKTGKSIMAEGMANDIASGQKVFGKLRTLQSDVMYYEMELGKEVSLERWKAINKTRPRTDRLHIDWSLPRFDLGGYEYIVQDLNENPNIKVIFIDVLANFMPTRDLVEGTAYQKDYAFIQPLAKLASDYSVSIVGVHHKSKAEQTASIKQASGSMGLVAASDILWDLVRTREHADISLEISGKMVREDTLELIPRNGNIFDWELLEGENEE